MRQKCRHFFSRFKEQTGAIVVEATVSLTVFMFTMLTMLSISQMAYTQARIAVSLDSVAREMSQYAHLWFATGMDKIYTGEGGKSSGYTKEAADVVKAVGEFFGKLSGMNKEIAGGALGDATGLTPLFGTSQKVFGEGGAALEGDSLTDVLKHSAGKALTLPMLKGRLKSWQGDTADQFMRRNHVINLKAGQTKFLEGGKDIYISVSYDIRVMRLLNIDFKFHMKHFSYTQAWGGASSK